MHPMIRTKTSRMPKRDVIQCAIGKCTLGTLLVAASENGICAITLGDNPKILLRDLQNRFPQAILTPGDPSFDATIAAVLRFMEHPDADLSLPLDIHGTAFQQRVWKALRKIPRGQTATYQDIAKKIHHPKAVRAVANACAANHLAIVIPCHRVVRTNGSLSGYRWGVKRKTALLQLERTSYGFAFKSLGIGR